MIYDVGEFAFFYSNYYFESDSDNNIYIYDLNMKYLDFIRKDTIEHINTIDDFKINCYEWISKYKKRQKLQHRLRFLNYGI